jgi:hypothetical protein
MSDEIFRALCQSPGDNPGDRFQPGEVIVHSLSTYSGQPDEVSGVHSVMVAV